MPDTKIKQKQYFDVKVEATIPAILTYRIFAYDAQEALEQIKRSNPTNVKPILTMKRLIKATVYKASSSLMLLTKNFRL
jgi:hypothetical protein